MTQAWRVICHGCLASDQGYAPDREQALSAIEIWKSEHRLRPGCSYAYTSHSVAGVSNQESKP